MTRFNIKQLACEMKDEKDFTDCTTGKKSFQRLAQEMGSQITSNTVNVLNIRRPKKFVVITLKFELCGSTIE